MPYVGDTFIQKSEEKFTVALRGMLPNNLLSDLGTEIRRR